MPSELAWGFVALSGIAMYRVEVFYNSPEPKRVWAHAFARDREIHLAPGQEEHLPHEAWHVVQQAEGRVPSRARLGGVDLNDDAGLEIEASRLGERAWRLGSTARDVSTPLGPTPLTGAARPAVMQRVLDADQTEELRAYMRQQIGFVAEPMVQAIARRANDLASARQQVDRIAQQRGGGGDRGGRVREPEAPAENPRRRRRSPSPPGEEERDPDVAQPPVRRRRVGQAPAPVADVQVEAPAQQEVVAAAPARPRDNEARRERPRQRGLLGQALGAVNRERGIVVNDELREQRRQEAQQQRRAQERERTRRAAVVQEVQQRFDRLAVRIIGRRGVNGARHHYDDGQGVASSDRDLERALRAQIGQAQYAGRDRGLDNLSIDFGDGISMIFSYDPGQRRLTIFHAGPGG
ncbi:MAG: hypothetical protein AAGD38_07840 [Acidobacteriota bacterium]